MTLDQSIRILKISCLITVAYGTAFILFLIPEQSLFNNFFADIAHMPLDGQQSVSTETERLLLAIVAGLMIGFAGFVWQITKHVYANDPALGAKIMTPAILGWFITDGIGSLLAGAWFNVVMNTGFLALFLVPILMHQKASKSRDATSSSF